MGLFFCEGCPLGYSAIGGQTLNPYGRKKFETGGSSSGSGAAVAANYAVAAVGTETSGSITSPSSQNSVVGLKPGPGVLSRSGIVPISSTLDTPGPMTKFVVDNLILLDGMIGQDPKDVQNTVYKSSTFNTIAFDSIVNAFSKRKVGVFSYLYSDTIYKQTIDKITSFGANVLNLKPEEMSYTGFLNLLTTDMRNDLSKYLKTMSADTTSIQNTEQIVAFNKKDSVKRMPYGQKLLYGIVKDTTTEASLHKLKNTLKKNAQKYLGALSKKSVSVILSINNYHSGVAALAGYPTLTIPMGYRSSVEPVSLTLIGLPDSEQELLTMGFTFEKQIKIRRSPKNYNQIVCKILI
ncbi:amidase family protein [Tenacibaculum sp. SG-28]|uniref:amidase family protein n=1 Tax=Tenacibaculum sp. SG-28 TaxID=754426 RepID=UPI0021016FA9|nr:amidase family protein [Tenacibaculum sp. SG-28]